MQKIYAYIYFPENIDIHINNLNEGKKLLEDFQMTLDLIDCEKDSVIYYSNTNKDSFLEKINICEDLLQANFIGNYSFENIINILLNGSDIYVVDEEISNDCLYFVYNSITQEIDKNTPVIFKTISQHNIILTDSQKQIIINLFNEYFAQNPISVIIDCKTDENKMFNVQYISNFKELDSWLQINRKERAFNKTDSRHILGSPNYIPGKSPLLGGIGGRDNAETLLRSAIGDKKNSNNINDLMNYDDQNNEYIWFEYEGNNPQNQFHAYHLVNPTPPHERDTKAVNKISNRVLKILKYRKEN